MARSRTPWVRGLLERGFGQRSDDEQRDQEAQGRDRLDEGEVGEERHGFAARDRLDLLLRARIDVQLCHLTSLHSGLAMPCFRTIAKCSSIPTTSTTGRMKTWRA